MSDDPWDGATSAEAPRWPDVPACYGWLSLDRRGAWRLKGEAVRHLGLIAFLNRNYGTDGNGNWLVSNGPQKVYVDLDYLPTVARLQADGSFVDHTGNTFRQPAGVWLDDQGSILMQFDVTPALLDDRDLLGFLDAALVENGAPVAWQGLPILAVSASEVALRFGFNPRPSQE